MSKKLLSGFALLVCAALVGVVVNDNPTTYADDSEKASPNSANVAVPEVLPVGEAPLYPGKRVGVCNAFGDGMAYIDTIADGHLKTWYVHGDVDRILKFQLRTDGWRHTSVKFFGTKDGKDSINGYAVILVPDERSLTSWIAWYPKAATEAREREAKWEARRKGPSERAYPANVLPPK